jgi:outer membrane lipoprotein-sorting protein
VPVTSSQFARLTISRIALLILLAALAGGCAMSRRTVVKPSGPPVAVQNASKQQLIESYDHQANSITSMNAAVTMVLTAGSAYTGVIEQYHEVSGFILAQKPADVRVIGQAPVVGTDIFDMVSDGQTFHIFIPSKNQFLEGPAELERPSAKPIENLRPQHLTGALFWNEIPPDDPVLLEQARQGPSSYYVLTVIQRVGPVTATAAEANWEIARKIWFDRASLNVSRIETYDSGGQLASDDGYSNWDNFGAERYARDVSVHRPASDYTLDIHITRLTLNVAIASDRFVLKQPAGTELVRVGEPNAEAQPGNTQSSGGAK